MNINDMCTFNFQPLGPHGQEIQSIKVPLYNVLTVDILFTRAPDMLTSLLHVTTPLHEISL